MMLTDSTFPTPMPATTEALLFNTAFNGSTRLAPAVGPYFHGPREQYEDFRGIDGSVAGPSDWDRFGDIKSLGDLRLYYEGGDPTQRWAKIVTDEADPGRRLLRFWLGSANVTIAWPAGPEHKARVQAELYGNQGLYEVYQRVSLRVHRDFRLLERFPATFDWMTLLEFWNQPFWGGAPYPFRISMGLSKLDARPGSPLHFAAHAQTMVGPQQFELAWAADARDFRVPYDQWMTLEVYYKEGDAQGGRFFVAVTPQGESRQVVLDVADVTHHPRNPAPAGLTHYNPMKLYTSGKLVDFVRGQGGIGLQLDWTDFAIWKGRRPADSRAGV